MKTEIIPDVKQDGPPFTLSVPKMPKLDKLAKTLMLIDGGIGLALAGVVAGLVNDEDDKSVKDNQTEQDDAQ